MNLKKMRLTHLQALRAEAKDIVYDQDGRRGARRAGLVCLHAVNFDKAALFLVVHHGRWYGAAGLIIPFVLSSMLSKWQ